MVGCAAARSRRPQLWLRARRRAHARPQLFRSHAARLRARARDESSGRAALSGAADFGPDGAEMKSRVDLLLLMTLLSAFVAWCGGSPALAESKPLVATGAPLESDDLP